MAYRNSCNLPFSLPWLLFNILNRQTLLLIPADFLQYSEIIFFIEIDNAGNICSSNELFTATLGRAAKDMAGQPFYQCLHISDQRMVIDFLGKLMGENDVKPRRLITQLFSRIAGEMVFVEWEFFSVNSADNIRRITGLGTISRSALQVKKQKEREEQLILFVRQSPAALAMFDTHMNYIAISHRWEEEYEVKEGSIAGRNHYDLITDIPQHWKDVHQRSLAGATEKHEEDIFHRADGTTEWIRWETFPWYKGSGEIGGIIMFTEILTGKKKAEQAVIGERDISNSFINSLPGIFYLLDRDMKCIRWNKRLEEISGYAEDEMPIINFPDLFTDEDKNLIQHKFREAFISGHSETEAVIVTKAGKKIPYILTAVLTSYENKPCFVGMGMDISERKRIELEHLEAEEKFRNLVEQSLVGVCIIQDGRFAYVNPKFAELTGYTETELAQDGSINLIVGELAIASISRNIGIILEGRSDNRSYQITCSKKDGQLVQAEVFGSRMTYKGHPAVIGVVIDITERNKAQLKIIEQNENLEKIAFIQSHVLRRPLANILGLWELMQAEIQKDVNPQHWLYLMEHLATSVRETDNVIREIVLRSRENTGKE